jgi:lipopolysaccharide cholinephosphotransferase
MGKKPAGGGKRIAERIASRALGPWARERDETVAELTEQVKVLQAQVGEQREIMESHHALLSRLMLSEEMRPVGALKLLQDLCLELLWFVHQVCERHGITYWLDCGSLLGPVRHKGFIPWDDDIDIAMARPDYRRFLVALDAEIERLGLQDSVVPTRLRCDAEGTRVVAGHLQIKYGDGESMPGMVDVFPYDYLSEEGAARFDAKVYRRAVGAYRRGLLGSGAVEGFTTVQGTVCVAGGDMSEAEAARLGELSAPLGIALEEGPFLVPGLDSVKYARAVPVAQVSPTSSIAFGDYVFAAPNAVRDYLTGMYGRGYMELPPVIERHSRIPRLRRRPDGEEFLGSLIDAMRGVNERF